MFFQVFKVSPWVSFLTFFFFCQIAVAQRLQVQFQVGMNASQAFIEDNGQLNRETATFYDTINNIQLGLAVNAQTSRKNGLRALHVFDWNHDRPCEIGLLKNAPSPAL